MKRSGSVTVFLALVITCCSALICALTESARTAGTRFYVRTMADSAIDSLFSQYHEPLWECYRLLGYQYGDDGNAAQDLENFMKPYVENCGWYAVSSPTVQISKRTFLTDDGGVWFEQEILDYLKYGWINLNCTPASAEALWKQVREAQIMDEILKDYGPQSKQAVAMEQAIMRIHQNLSAQDSMKQEARSLVRNGQNAAFQRASNQLSGLVHSLPALIERYDQKADAYSMSLSALKQKHAAQLSQLQEENRTAIEEQIAVCHEYADRDGQRRQALDALDDSNDAELQAISDVQRLADETEAYIEEAEDDEEDGDGIDEDALWQSVAEAWDFVPIPHSNITPGIRDEKTESLLETILKLASKGYLHIILPPDRQLPEGSIDTSNFPSRYAVTPRKGPAADLLRAIAVDEYAGAYLPSFTDQAQTPISCQLEYVVAGKSSDQANLTAAAAEILAIREALNLIFIMTTPALRRQAHEIAELIASATALPELTILIECLIMSAWALVESFMDLRLLLGSQKAAIYKTREDWMTSMEDVLAFASTLRLPAQRLKESKKGISYEAYLKLLLFTKSSEIRNYRTMDMIQAALVPADPDFRFQTCLYGLQTSVSCESRHLFTNLSFTRPSGDSSKGYALQFPIRTESVKAY